LGKGGYAPFPFYTPLQPEYLWYIDDVSGWRGIRDEATNSQANINKTLLTADRLGDRINQTLAGFVAKEDVRCQAILNGRQSSTRRE
jgi:hypothetical protein